MFRKILIANRGEIACRIARTCRRMGIGVAAVHSAADRDALHVREIGESIELGGAPAAESYLAIDKIIAAAQRAGADAVHPGYGFLAENAAFAAALAAAGITFIGPSADILACFGDKAAAKAAARAAGVPVVPGPEQPLGSLDEVDAAAGDMKLPLLLKAAAGGGGKGMRVVTARAEIRAQAAAAMREAKAAFGDDRLILEEYRPRSRHIEVQILGDGAGTVIHLLDRECSLQRRHQKVIEEAPVLSLDAPLRAKILGDAVRLGQAVRYLGLGTVEFIVHDGKAFFLEVNPRLQVEHPVTEAVTGLDLIELQIRTLAEGSLPITQDQVMAQGVAIEARLYAEDPANGFLPAAGTITHLHFPGDVRVDAGIEEGMEITPHYDPMIAKIISHGGSREEACRRLASALGACRAGGVTTNLALLRTLLANPLVHANTIHTGTIDEIVAAASAPVPSVRDATIAAALWLHARREQARPDCPYPGAFTQWPELTGWRLGTGEPALASAPALRLRAGASGFEVRFGALTAPDTVLVRIDDRDKDGQIQEVRIRRRADGIATVAVDGHSFAVTPDLAEDRAGFLHEDRAVRFTAETYLSGRRLAGTEAGDGSVRAPMMGRIVAIAAVAGQAVSAGDRLGAMESMKMELTLSAPLAGTLAEIRYAVDAMVERDDIVFVIEPAREDAA